MFPSIKLYRNVPWMILFQIPSNWGHVLPWQSRSKETLKNLLLRNYWTTFNQIIQKCSWEVLLLALSKFMSSNKHSGFHGNQAPRTYKFFFSIITGPSLTKLHRNFVIYCCCIDKVAVWGYESPLVIALVYIEYLIMQCIVYGALYKHKTGKGTQ